MSSRLKGLLQYAVILLLTVFLIWVSLRSIPEQEGQNKFDYLSQTWSIARKEWLLLMAVFAMASHVLRAIRWRMLLRPTGHETTVTASFLSLMVGYLVNLVIPRGGELSRCYNLYKLDSVPVDVSFGTVVVERVVDLICLAALLGLAFLLEYDKLVDFVASLPIAPAGSSSALAAGYIVAGILLVVGVIYWLFKRNSRFRNFLNKIWSGVRSGLMSIFRLEQKGRFVAYTIAIWVLYFGMSYSVIKAFPITSHLGFNAMISLFGIGSIAMAAPLPGGTGSYHVLVPQGLTLLYDIPIADSVALTFIFHGWQTLIMIVGGSVSLIVTSVWVKQKKKA